MVLRHVLTVEADKNVTAMQAAQIADVFEGNLPSESKLRHQIEHFEPDSAHQNRRKKFECRKHKKNMSEKGNERNGPEPNTGKNGSYHKVDTKPKKKRDLSKLPHFGKKNVCWSCGEPRNANVNNGCKSPFHKKPVAVYLTTVELPSVGDVGSFENPTVCRIDVTAYHNSCNVTSTESYDSCESYDKSLKPDCVTTLETHSGILLQTTFDSDFVESVQPAELTDVYHNLPEELYQTDVPDMFDDLSDTFLSTLVKSHGSDPGLSASDTVVGKVTDDLSRQLSNSVKPLSYVPIQLQGHEQSYSCLSDNGCMIPIIKQSILQTGSKSSVSAFDNLGPVKLTVVVPILRSNRVTIYSPPVLTTKP